MGWISYHATHYLRNGSVNKKAECDAYFMEGLNQGHYQVLKSSMKGSVYYAAVRELLRPDGLDENGRRKYVPCREEEQTVFAVIFLTSLRQKSFFNFAYKPMDETYGPLGLCDCPNSILKLLSPTSNAYALEWRNKCREQNSKKSKLRKLKTGSKILVYFRSRDDEGTSFTKHRFGERDYWLKDGAANRYIKQSDLLLYDFDVITQVV